MASDGYLGRLTRRWTLLAGSGAVAALTAGCLGDFDGGPRDEDPLKRDGIAPDEVELTVEVDGNGTADASGRTPAEAVVAFYEAVLDGDTDEADRLVHRDAPIRPVDVERDEEQLSYIDAMTAARTAREVDELAAVDARVDVRGVGSTMAYHLRLDDRRWTRWTTHPGVDAGAAPVAAIVADIEDAIVFEHEAGDELPVDALSFAGVDADGHDRRTELDDPEPWIGWNGEEIAGTFGPGDRLRVTLEDREAFAGGEVALVHEADGDALAFPRPFAGVPEL